MIQVLPTSQRREMMGRGEVQYKEYDIAISEDEMEDLDIEWQDPSEDIKDIIENQTGHRPDGHIHTMNVDQPAPQFSIGSREPVETTGQYTISVEFFSVPKPRDDPDDDAVDALKFASGSTIEFEASPEGYSAFTEFGEPPEHPMEPTTMFLDEDTHEALKQEMGFTGSFSIAADEIVDELEGEKATDGGNSWVGDIPTETCPECEDEFEKDSGIDGDDGTEFCSLECLNEHMNP